jgi:5-methylcytosine-specific restriction endonuclease McrA
LEEEPNCRLCGQSAVTVDHIIARRFGGTDDGANLRSLCRRCADQKDQVDAREGRRRAREQRTQRRGAS